MSKIPKLFRSPKRMSRNFEIYPFYQQYSSAPVSEINRSQGTLQSQSAVQSFQSGQLGPGQEEEESEYESEEEEETSEYESEELEPDQPTTLNSRPSTVRTGWH